MSKLACYAVCLPGLESLLAEELAEIGIETELPDSGGVAFEATMDAVMRVNLRSRIATRVLIRLASFKAFSFPELYNKCRRIDWSRYVTADTKLKLRVSCQHSRLMHTGRIEAAVSDAIANRWGGDLQQVGDAQLIVVRFEADRCLISIDSSGERLDRRGYRLHSGMAPVRETMAAAILKWMHWQPDQPLLLPMCGSGTFAVEAVWMAEQRPAGMSRDFAFMQWPCFKAKRWQRVRDKSVAMLSSQKRLKIYASDIDAAIVTQADANFSEAGCRDQIDLSAEDVLDMQPPEALTTCGVILCNPPYGRRIEGDATAIYRQLGQRLKAQFRGWRVAVIVPDKRCRDALGLTADKQIKMRHGGSWVSVVAATL